MESQDWLVTLGSLAADLLFTFLPFDRRKKCCPRSLEISNVLKGILFVQEMYEDFCIDHFYRSFPAKYDFLFKRGESDDEMIFQGSTAEGLAIFNIYEEEDPDCDLYNLNWFRNFDYDIMHVKKTEVLDERSEFSEIFCNFVQKRGGRPEQKIKAWKEAKFCKHKKEPWVMMRVPDEDDECGLMVEHVGLVQPACSRCVLRQPQGNNDNKIIEYQGRPMIVKSPHTFWLEFHEQSYKKPIEKDREGRDVGHGCDSHHWMGGMSFNRHGDLCGKCQELNSTTIFHKGAKTEMFLDKVVNAGPSIMFRFYMTHEGKVQEGLPLFNDPGVSTVDCDNIPALRYPRLDWSHWAALLRDAGMPGIPERLSLRWPYDCREFSKPTTISGWPSLRLKHEVMEAGCQIVPRIPRRLGEKGPKTYLKLPLHHITHPPCWRISFSLSERLLVDSFTHAQRRCFLLLKVFMKVLAKEINKELEAKHGEDNYKAFKVSSFLLKHTMFWTLEDVDPLEWRMNNLHGCMIHVLLKLEVFLREGCVPHYFFGKRKNLLAGDISENTMEEVEAMTKKCSVMVEGVSRLMDISNFPNYTKALVANGSYCLDFQWQESSLRSEMLVKSFDLIVEEDSKEKLISHHKVMIEQINSAPRKYGAGINQELVDFLEEEVTILSSSRTACLESLDAAEKVKLIEKIENSGEKKYKAGNLEEMYREISMELLDNIRYVQGNELKERFVPGREGN